MSSICEQKNGWQINIALEILVKPVNTNVGVLSSDELLGRSKA